MRTLQHTVLLFFVLLVASAFGAQEQETSRRPDSAKSLVKIKSDFTAQETADRLEALVEKKDALTLMARINHSQNAEKASLELPPTLLLVFGNPNLGTPLMQAERTVGIDLPQKVLIWEDGEGQTWVAYNDPLYLKERHAVEGKDDVFKKIDAALRDLVSKAAGEETGSKSW